MDHNNNYAYAVSLTSFPRAREMALVALQIQLPQAQGSPTPPCTLKPHLMSPLEK